MGHRAISLWEEAAPLERNRTGCDGGREGWVRCFGKEGDGQTGTAGPGQLQKTPTSVLRASRASIVVTLISTS